jgi:hypothetical protein
LSEIGREMPKAWRNNPAQVPIICARFSGELTSARRKPMAMFQIDDPAILATIDDLRAKLGANSSAEVIQKALALAKVATANADSTDALTIVSPDKKTRKILLKK